MNLSTPSVQAIRTYLHYRAATQVQSVVALDVEGNTLCSTHIVRLTLPEIAANACLDTGKCVGLTTTKKALACLRREGLLITLRSPVMGDVAGFHLLLDGAWENTPDVQDLVTRYREKIMTGYDYRRVVSLPVLTPMKSTPAQVPAAVKVDVAITFPAPAPLDLDFLEADYNPFDVAEEEAPPAPVEAAPAKKGCGCKADRAEKERVKAEERAAKQAERERIKAEKRDIDAALTIAARPIVECYVTYATEVRGSINYGLIWKKAKEIAQAGFTSDDVTNYLTHLRSQNYYKTRFINIVFIRENIGSYLLNRTARDGYDAYGRYDARLTKDAIEENARYERESAERAAANGGVDPGEDKTESLAMLHAFFASKPRKQAVATPA